MSHYIKRSDVWQAKYTPSNTGSTEPREPLETRKRRILEALRRIQHIPVKIGKYGRYIAPVAA